MASLNGGMQSSHGSRTRLTRGSSAAPVFTDSRGATSPVDRTPSPGLNGGISRTSSDADYEFTHSVDDSSYESNDHVKEVLYQAMNLTRNEPLRQDIRELIENHFGSIPPMMMSGTSPPIMVPDQDVVLKEGFLWKKGKALHLWSKRFYVVSGNCVYYYGNKEDVRPKGVIFLTGYSPT